MSGFTTKYAIPTLGTGDSVASAPTTLTALANRVDLLLGEAGQSSFTGAAATTISVAVVLSRTYPGNTGATVPGIVIIQHVQSLGSANVQNLWINTWTGTATTITGFTINMQSSNAPAARLVAWRFLPVL